MALQPPTSARSVLGVVLTSALAAVTQELHVVGQDFEIGGWLDRFLQARIGGNVEVVDASTVQTTDVIVERSVAIESAHVVPDGELLAHARACQLVEVPVHRSQADLGQTLTHASKHPVG